MGRKKTKTPPTSSSPRRMAVLAFLAFSCLLQALSFHPANAWFLAWVALVPWIVIVVKLKWVRATFWSLVLGYAFFLIGANWLAEVHIGALLFIAAPLAGFYAVFGLILNILSRKGKFPLTLAVPVAWVAVEYLRSFVLTGFPWLYLAHTQYPLTALIQISDITGAYGVSLIVATVNGLIADVVSGSFNRRRLAIGRAGLIVRVAATVAVIAGASIYGALRLAEVRREMRPGPEVLLVQPNVPQELKSNRGMNRDVFAECLEMTRTAFERAAAKGKPPDLVVWPETILPPRWDASGGETAGEKFVHKGVKEEVDKLLAFVGCPLLSGGVHVRNEPTTIHWYNPEEKQFVEEELPYTETHNSVYYFDKGGRQVGRYDKMHLVPYGEYIALQDVLPFLREGIRHFAGIVRELEAGSERQRIVYSLPSRDGKLYTFCAPICYEIIFPALIARMVSSDGTKKDAQMIITVSNDGWFKESAELEQTTVIAAFRAVENRVGIARCTNTGISGFLKPDGTIAWEADFYRDPISGEMKSVTGAIQRPVYVCDILTTYSRVKDVFAVAVCALCGLMLIYSIVMTAIRRGESAGG